LLDQWTRVGRLSKECFLFLNFFPPFYTEAIEDPAQVVKELKELLRKLPEHNRNLWMEISKFLYKLSQRAEENKMTCANIGIVWGPNMLWTANFMPALEMNHVVAELVKYHSTLFAEV